MGYIRLLLALSVVIFHSGAILGCGLVGGRMAVQAFFIISGFYMTLILNEKYIAGNSSYSLFISNRFFRLFPVYWFVLIGSILLYAAYGIISNSHFYPRIDYYFSSNISPFAFVYLVFTNLFMFFQDIVLFLGIQPESGNLFFTGDFRSTDPPLHYFLIMPQAWTLALELTFYLIAPFLLRRKPIALAALLLGSISLRVFMYNFLGLRDDPWTQRFFPTEFMFFLLGYFSYKMYRGSYLKNTSLRTGQATLLFVLGFTVVYSIIPDYQWKYSPFSIKDIFYYLVITFSIPVLFKTFRNSRLDTQIGELSYPVYVCHYTIIVICALLPVAFLRESWMMAIISLITAFLLNKFIAEPMETYRQARLKRPQIRI